MNPRPSRTRMVLMCMVMACIIATAMQLAAQAPDIAKLSKQAKQGNAEAQYLLADAYFEGKGVSKDAKQGVEWLRKAASQDHPAAQNALWVMYRQGFRPADIPKDPKQGLTWLQKSADHGYATAEYNLAVLYRDGDSATSISPNPHEAAAWFRKAARQPGNPGSRAELEKMLKSRLISEAEANWRPPLSVDEVETGLKGWISSKRMATLVQKFGVEFKLSAAIQKRLKDDGADDGLLQTISTSKRSL